MQKGKKCPGKPENAVLPSNLQYCTGRFPDEGEESRLNNSERGLGLSVS